VTSKLLMFTGVISGLFYFAVPLLYLLPDIAGNRVVGAAMLTVTFFVVAPTWVALAVRLCRSGLKTEGGLSRQGNPV
jgi:hypothetical protein